MTDSAEDFHASEEFDMQPLEDDCRLMSSILDQCLRLEVGDVMFHKVEKIRALAHCAANLSQKGDAAGSAILYQRMANELLALNLDEAIPLTRACSHYLNLTGVAELQQRLRRNREGRGKGLDDVFQRLISEGVSPDKLYESITQQKIEVVLTAHPTQVNRRTLQYKHTKIAALLQQNDRTDLIKEERELVLDDLVREVTALWQTDELRRQKPTPIDEARGGLHIVEQSLWNAVPAYMRRLSTALKKHTGRDLPLFANPFKFSSWMGGDRDGNPNVTSKVTQHVVWLSSWMAADLYLKEVEALRFELSMSQCSSEAWRMAKAIIREHNSKKEKDLTAGRKPAAHNTTELGTPMGSMTAGHGAHHSATPSKHHLRSHRLPDKGVGSVGHGDGGRPEIAEPTTVATITGALSVSLDAMPHVPGPMPGMDEVQGGSDQDFDDDDDANRVLSVSQLRVSCDIQRKKGNAVEGASDDEELDTIAELPCAAGANSDLDRMASIGLSDPTLLRKSYRLQRSNADTVAFKKGHDHPGFHPYRIILGEVRERLVATRKRYEDLLNRQLPANDGQFYVTEEELEAPLRTIYWSLYECGGGIIADGRLLDLIRRVATFGMTIMKLDVRQESTRHAEALDEITQYLGYGSYLEWDEERRIQWLTKELEGRRPLVPLDMPMSEDVREVLDTFRVCAELGRSSLGAYVISMTKGASDVLAVELLQREAMLHVCAEEGIVPKVNGTLRVVPLFETLDDLEASSKVMNTLFSNAWYRQHLTDAHNDEQEVMLGYSDSGKDAGRLAANWALYTCQEMLVADCKNAGVQLTLFHGRGGTVGRGGGPTYLAIQSQPPGSVENRFRITEQGEMVQAKFGISAVAQWQCEIYTTAVLQASLKPPNPPKLEAWRNIMSMLSKTSCDAYRAVVVDHPKFISYFKNATPEAQLGMLNIGSRPARRRADNAGISTLRAIPWQFAWTQTRLILPSWLGIGEALQEAIAKGHRNEMRQMYHEWPFFQATFDLISMILAKTDPRIAGLYDEVLVEDPLEKKLGQELRDKLNNTVKAVLTVTGHTRLLEDNPTLRRLIEMRNPYIDPLNVIQVEILRRLRAEPENDRLKDALLVSINGISAGMRNTG